MPASVESPLLIGLTSVTAVDDRVRGKNGLAVWRRRALVRPIEPVDGSGALW
ncbi:MAG: hypothetical protein ACRDG4_02560 [Chloroflexota bacterium]